MSIMRRIFSNIFGCPEEEKIQEAYRNAMSTNHAMQKKIDSIFRRTESSLRFFAVRFRNLSLVRVFIRAKTFLLRLISSNRELLRTRKHSKS